MLRAVGSSDNSSGGKTRRSGRGAGQGRGSGPVTAPNPPIGNVAALLHLDGANGGTTFTDVKGTTWSRNVGSGTTSTVQKKYGTASLLVGGGGGILNSTAPSLSYTLGTQDFCMEFWFYPTSNTAAWLGGLWTVASSFGSYVFYWDGTGKVGMLGSKTDTNWDFQCFADSALALNQWHHVAGVRRSGVFALYVDGIRQSTTATDAANYPLTGNLYIGQSRTGNGPTGSYFDDSRLTMGDAIYSSNFIPPTQAFPDS